MTESQIFIEEITQAIAQRFPSFGGNKTNNWNPIAAALADKPPQFAAGVDIETVVEFVVNEFFSHCLNRIDDLELRVKSYSQQ